MARDCAGAVASGAKSDRDLAQAVAKYVDEMPAVTGSDREGVSRVSSDPTKQADQEYQK